MQNVQIESLIVNYDLQIFLLSSSLILAISSKHSKVISFSTCGFIGKIYWVLGYNNTDVPFAKFR